MKKGSLLFIACFQALAVVPPCFHPRVTPHAYRSVVGSQSLNPSPLFSHRTWKGRQPPSALSSVADAWWSIRYQRSRTRLEGWLWSVVAGPFFETWNYIFKEIGSELAGLWLDTVWANWGFWNWTRYTSNWDSLLDPRAADFVARHVLSGAYFEGKDQTPHSLPAFRTLEGDRIRAAWANQADLFFEPFRSLGHEAVRGIERGVVFRSVLPLFVLVRIPVAFLQSWWRHAHANRLARKTNQILSMKVSERAFYKNFSQTVAFSSLDGNHNPYQVDRLQIRDSWKGFLPQSDPYAEQFIAEFEKGLRETFQKIPGLSWMLGRDWIVPRYYSDMSREYETLFCVYRAATRQFEFRLDLLRRQFSQLIVMAPERMRQRLTQLKWINIGFLVHDGGHFVDSLNGIHAASVERPIEVDYKGWVDVEGDVRANFFRLSVSRASLASEAYDFFLFESTKHNLEAGSRGFLKRDLMYLAAWKQLWVSFGKNDLVMKTELEIEPMLEWSAEARSFFTQASRYFRSYIDGLRYDDSWLDRYQSATAFLSYLGIQEAQRPSKFQSARILQAFPLELTLSQQALLEPFCLSENVSGASVQLLFERSMPVGMILERNKQPFVILHFGRMGAWNNRFDATIPRIPIRSFSAASRFSAGSETSTNRAALSAA